MNPMPAIAWEAPYTSFPSDSRAQTPSAPMRFSRRQIAIAGGVVLFHAAALWALQSGLVRRSVEVVVSVSMVSEIITPPAPKVETPVPVPAAPQPAPKPVARQVERPRPVPPAPAPRPLAVPDAAPAPRSAPTGELQPQPVAPPISAPVAAAPAPAPAAPARVELPSSEASYLQNPLPVYPPMSKRLGEQGTVLVRVLIGADGLPKEANVKQGSGFDRLDRAAVNYVMVCRYVPGKVGGVPQAMWYDAPVKFNLE
jgi:protein TonB